MSEENRIEQCLADPANGPSLLFFSGGSALDKTSSLLTKYTHNSIHLLTPFDSGGSSAKLRKAFNMPAVGDLRARLMAIADDSIEGHPEAVALFRYRLPTDLSQASLKKLVEQLQSGEHPLVEATSITVKQLIANNLRAFLDQVPDNFDYRGASVGNLVITGGYLINQHTLNHVVDQISEIVNALGIVRTTTNDDLELIATLADGTKVSGQHKITAKETHPLDQKIIELVLSGPSSSLDEKNQALISHADLIIFPPGSFFSSVIANLLPKSVGNAIHESSKPKVFIPNLGTDPELYDTSLVEQIELLNQTINRDLPDSKQATAVDIVLTDSTLRSDIDEAFNDYLSTKNIQLLDMDLRGHINDVYDEKKLIEALIKISRR